MRDEEWVSSYNAYSELRTQNSELRTDVEVRMGPKTHIVKGADISREWFVIDAAGKRLGRLSSDIAYVLRGKHKPYYTPTLDVGDYVIVVNADKVAVTGNKLSQKMYYRHSGYPGGFRA